MHSPKRRRDVPRCHSKPRTASFGFSRALPHLSCSSPASPTALGSSMVKLRRENTRKTSLPHTTPELRSAGSCRCSPSQPANIFQQCSLEPSRILRIHRVGDLGWAPESGRGHESRDKAKDRIVNRTAFRDPHPRARDAVWFDAVFPTSAKGQPSIGDSTDQSARRLPRFDRERDCSIASVFAPRWSGCRRRQQLDALDVAAPLGKRGRRRHRPVWRRCEPSRMPRTGLACYAAIFCSFLIIACICIRPLNG